MIRFWTMTTTHLPTHRVFYALLPDTNIRKALSREVDDIVAAGQRGLRWLQASATTATP